MAKSKYNERMAIEQEEAELEQAEREMSAEQESLMSDDQFESAEDIKENAPKKVETLIDETHKSTDHLDLSPDIQALLDEIDSDFKISTQELVEETLPELQRHTTTDLIEGAPSDAATAFQIEHADIHDPERNPVETPLPKSPATLEENISETDVDEILSEKNSEITSKSPLTQEEFDKEQRERLTGKKEKPAYKIPEDPEWVDQFVRENPLDIKKTERMTSGDLVSEAEQRFIATRVEVPEIRKEVRSGFEAWRARMPRVFHGWIDRFEASNLSQKADTEYEALSKMKATLDRLSKEYDQLSGKDLEGDPTKIGEGKGNSLFEINKKLVDLESQNIDPATKDKERARLINEQLRVSGLMEKVRKERDNLTPNYEQSRKAFEDLEHTRDQAVERVNARIDEKLRPHEQKLLELEAQKNGIKAEIDHYNKTFQSFNTQIKELEKNKSSQLTLRALRDQLDILKETIADREVMLDEIGAKIVPLTSEISTFLGHKISYENLSRKKDNDYSEQTKTPHENMSVSSNENFPETSFEKTESGTPEILQTIPDTTSNEVFKDDIEGIHSEAESSYAERMRKNEAAAYARKRDVTINPKPKGLFAGIGRFLKSIFFR